MLTFDEILGIVYLLLGFLGDCILFFLNSFSFYIVYRIRLRNLIIMHLSFSNVMVLFFRGIPARIKLWRVKCLRDDTGIKIIIYMQTLGRNFSLYSTCFLSVFQAIIIILTISFWAQFKMRTPKCIIVCILLCWIFNLFLNMVLFLYHDSPKNRTDSKYGCNTEDRYLNEYNKNQAKMALIICIYNYLFVCLMPFSSVDTVSILYKHKKHVSHIHTNSLSTKKSHETIASQGILILVSIFVCFKVFSQIFALCMFYFNYTHNWMIHTSIFFSLWYPAVSPLILISIDSQIPRTCVHR
ncbi:LOW QUALITY PROTEIN: vomeronasal type-1 receptor 1-like [Sminthopsis crassicaudata]|uniref:LOW QUALITY PROTEIN: vomeronasal type-1 receptor 1-like n=1 Tax=Sminthopsis crassicaudata TaxID=9301 RepID=UPI003D689B88